MKKIVVFVLLMTSASAFGQAKGLALASVAYFNESIVKDQLYIIQDIVVMEKRLDNNHWSAKNYHFESASILTFIIEIPNQFIPKIERYDFLYSNVLTVRYKGRVQVETTGGYLRMVHYFLLTSLDESKL